MLEAMLGDLNHAAQKAGNKANWTTAAFSWMTRQGRRGYSVPSEFLTPQDLREGYAPTGTWWGGASEICLCNSSVIMPRKAGTSCESADCSKVALSRKAEKYRCARTIKSFGDEVLLILRIRWSGVRIPPGAPMKNRLLEQPAPHHPPSRVDLVRTEVATPSLGHSVHVPDV